MFFRLSAVVLVFALVVLGTPVTRDGATVVSDVEGLGTKLTALDNSIEEFSGSGRSLKDAWNAHLAAQELAKAIQSTTDDVNASPALTEAQSATIAQFAENYAPLAEKTCNDIIADKADFEDIHLGSVVEDDLKTLDTEGEALGAALQGKVTADQAAYIQKQFDAVHAALANAINIYA